MTGREFGLEDPELQVPNRPQTQIPGDGEGLDFQQRRCLSRYHVERSETSRVNAFQKNKKRSFAPLRMTIAGCDLVFGILNFEQ